MASPDELAAIFASAWAAGAGSRPSMEQTAQLAALWKDAKRAQPDLDERDFAVALAGLAPGPEGLGAYLGKSRGPEVALAATMARGTIASVAPASVARSAPGLVPGSGDVKPGFAETIASGPMPSGAVTGPGTTPSNVPERYRIIKKLGAGAMGVVWEAEDTQLHRRVALKWVTPAAAGDRGYRTRLLREARALAQVHHANVMAVYDVGESGDELYLALELIDGTTAREATPSLAIWKQAGAGLAAVHAAGIVHRDVKPDNVFVARDGRVVIGDFGLATGDLGETIMATNLTATGAVVGTPLYMPPEQLHGDPATAKGDQFSLCVCAWEAITGKRPFDSTTIAGLAVAMLKPPPIPAGVDRRIVAALQRGLAPEPEQRWPDIPSLLAALEPAPAKRRGGLVAVIAALVVGAVGAVTLMQVMRSAPPADPAPPNIAPSNTAPSGTAPSNTAPPNTAPPPTANTPSGSAVAGTPVETAPAPVAPPGKPPSSQKPAAGGAGTAPAPAKAPPAAAKPPRVADDDSDNTPPTKSAWRAHYDDSISALRTGDGKKCLALVADRATWPADAYRELLSVEASLGACMMAAGDCEGGHRDLEAFGAKHNLAADDVARRIAFSDAKYCALDAPPKAYWPTRAAAKLEKLAYARQSCKPVLDFVDANHVVLPPDPLRARPLQLVMCLSVEGKCTEARALFLKDRGAGATGQMLDMVNHSFDLSFPTCAGN